MKERPRPKKDDDGEEGGDEWLLTYGDLMTQLVCFFVLLMSFAVMSSMKFRDVVISLHDALSGPGVLPAFKNVVGDIPRSLEEQDMQDEQIRKMKSEIEGTLEEQDMSSQVGVEIRAEGLVIILNQQNQPVLFDTADARVRDEAHPILNQIGDFIKDLPNNIRVEGHTDSRPINTPRFPSNWELSTMRATNVLRYLHAKTGISPDRLSAAGYGPYRHVAPNNTRFGMSKNRRVEIVILRMKEPFEQKTTTIQEMEKIVLDG